MTTRETSGAQAQREALSATPHHVGPTAERYYAAMERYLNFVAAAESKEIEAAEAAAAAHRAPARQHPARTVADVMTRDVVTVPEDAGFKEIALTLSTNRIDSLPVVDAAGLPVGVVATSDLLAHLASEARPVPRGHRLTAAAEGRRKHEAMTAKDLMTSPVITTTPSTVIAEAARQASRARVRMLPVISRDHHIVGVVTRGDLIRLFLRPDEDIRREVVNHVIAPLRLTERNRIDVTVEQGVVTLAGHVPTAHLGRLMLRETQRVSGVLEVHSKLESPGSDTFVALTDPLIGA